MDDTEAILDSLEDAARGIRATLLDLDEAVRGAVTTLTERSRAPGYDVITETALLVRMIGFCERTDLLRFENR